MPAIVSARVRAVVTVINCYKYILPLSLIFSLLLPLLLSLLFLLPLQLTIIIIIIIIIIQGQSLICGIDYSIKN